MKSMPLAKCIRCGGPTTRYMCVNCMKDDIKALPIITGFRRARAKVARIKRYPEWCDVHGEVDHHTDTGFCVECRPQFQRGDPLRIAARHAGEATYPGHCETHGRTGFHTAVGKCVTCFNAMGKPRPKRWVVKADAPEVATVTIAAVTRVSPSLGDWVQGEMAKGVPRAAIHRILGEAFEATKRARRRLV